MTYTAEVEHMCPLAKGAYHGPAPIPEEGKWVQAKKIEDISGFTHGVGWCAPQQGACKLSLNVKDGVIEEALVETIGCSGMTHSAAMASEILIGKTLLEALNTDLVCDAINTAMRELFMQIVYGRTQSAYSKDGLKVGASLEDLGKNLRSQVGTMFATRKTGPRYLFRCSLRLSSRFCRLFSQLLLLQSQSRAHTPILHPQNRSAALTGRFHTDRIRAPCTARGPPAVLSRPPRTRILSEPCLPAGYGLRNLQIMT